MKKSLFNVIVAKTGYVVCPECTLVEAAQCKKELIEIDKADGTYEKGFYAIVRANEPYCYHIV